MYDPSTYECHYIKMEYEIDRKYGTWDGVYLFPQVEEVQ